MASRPAKMDDVKRPDKLTPSTTSRPILVTNRPMLTTDPMMTPSDAVEVTNPAEQTARTAKTIEPVATVSKLVPPPVELTRSSPPATLESVPGPSGLDVDSGLSPKSDAQTVSDPVSGFDTQSELKPGSTEPLAAISSAAPAAEEPKRDTGAQIAADEAAIQQAQSAREQELEQMIASGKYTVPIDAIHRKRSRINVVLLLVVAIVLADVVLDMGLVTLPIGVPRTHLF